MEEVNFFLETDKQIHILISFLLFSGIFTIRKIILKNKGFFRVISYSIRDVLIIWILKEFLDLLWLWTPDFWDILADSLWIIIPIYIYYLIKESKKTENTHYFKYEKKLLNDIKKKISIKHFYKTTKPFIILSKIWMINLIILIFKIPFLAMVDTLEIFFKSLSYTFHKFKKMIK